MPNKFNFNILGSNRSCIEEGCEFSGEVWEVNDEKQKEHFMSHNASVIVNGSEVTLTKGLMQRVCRNCNATFNQKRRRGRPYLECEDCRGE